MNDEDTKEMLELVEDIEKPPVMIADGRKSLMQEERVNCWSRLYPPTEQPQFELTLDELEPTYPPKNRLEVEVD